MSAVGHQKAQPRTRLPAADASFASWRRRRPARAHQRQLRIHRGLMAGKRDEAGFTLVEVIVALAILATGLSLLLGLISNGLRLASSAQRMAEAGSLAQSLMAEVGTARPIIPEVRDGQYPNGHRWRLMTQPYDSAKENEERPVGLYKVSAEVEWEEGTERRFYALTTLRLGPRVARQ